MASLVRQIREVREAVEGRDRYLETALVLRRDKTKETLLYAGGIWDDIEKRYLDEDPTTIAVIDLEESQVPFIRFFDEFLADFREGYPRDMSAALAAGDRRAGKTFGVYGCQVAALVDVPLLPNGRRTLGWTVSKTYRERDELNQWIASYIPSNWYRATQAPEHRYDFRVGSALRNLSADDPDALKQGGVDFLFYNEVQKMAARAVVNGLYGTADHGGICLMSANRPSAKDSRGEWLFDLKDAIDDEAKELEKAQQLHNLKSTIADEVQLQAQERKREPLGIRYFWLSSKDNKKIDQPARRRVGRLAAIIDPTTAEVDDSDEGEWRRPGDKACWEFDKYKHLHAPATLGLADVTSQVLQRLWSGERDAAAGIDFQGHPHIPAAIAKLYGDVERPIYHFIDEHVEIGEKLTEERFLEGFEAQHGERYRRDNTLWICDASSTWQGPRHDFEGGERPSADVFEGDGWVILPSQAPSKNSKTGRGRNPFVDERLQLFNELLRQGRIRIDPTRCPWLVECVREATTKRDTGRRRLVANQYAHMIDAATYVVWRLERRPGGAPVKAEDIRVVRLKRRG